MYIKTNILFKVVLCSLVGYSSILLSPWFYCDDAIRIYTHMSINQNVHGRPFADLVYKMLANGNFMDISPLTQILALVCLGIAGILITNTFLKATKQELGEWEYFCVILFFCFFPLNYSLVSYRYDSITIAIAILCSVLAFTLSADHIYLAKFPRYCHIVFPAGLFTLTLGFYQPMTGIFFCCATFFLASNVLGNATVMSIIRNFIAFLRCALIGSIMYLPIYLQARYAQQQNFLGLGPHPYVNVHSKLLTISDFYSNIMHNLRLWLNTIISYLDRDIFFLMLIVLLSLFLGMVLTKSIHLLRKFLVLILVGLALLSGAGGPVFLANVYFPPRCCLALGVFVTMILLNLLINIKFKIIRKILICLAGVFIISSSGVLLALGNAYRDQHFYEQEIVYNGLSADLLALYARAENNLQFFYIIPETPPICGNLNFLIQKYGWLRASPPVAGTMAEAARYLSWLPINYDLNAAFYQTEKDRIDSFSPVITRSNYVIRATNDSGRYVVELRPVMVKNWLPVDVFKPGRFGKP